MVKLFRTAKKLKRTGTSPDERTESLREIHALQYRYAWSLDDAFDLDGFVDCFTADATWVSVGFGASLEGASEIREYFQRMKESTIQCIHYITQPHVDLAPDAKTASSRAYLLAIHTTVDDNGQHSTKFLNSFYLSDFVKVDDRWLFGKVMVRRRGAMEAPGWSYSES